MVSYIKREDRKGQTECSLHLTLSWKPAYTLVRISNKVYGGDPTGKIVMLTLTRSWKLSFALLNTSLPWQWAFCTSHTHSRVEGCTFTKPNPPYDRTEKANMELLAANSLSIKRADQGTNINGAMPKIGDNRQSTLQAFRTNLYRLIRRLR